jgi:azurin
MPRYLALFTLIFAVIGIGCSETPGSDIASAVPAAGGSPAAARPAPTTHDGRAVEITTTDAMKFSVTEITARAGEKLSVTVVNLGTTPKFSMGHNWVLIAANTDVPQFLQAAAEAAATDYVPAATLKASILSATKLLGPNERDTVTFTAPATPGRYDFLCSFPGHYQVGMRGVLIVQ